MRKILFITLLLCTPLSKLHSQNSDLRLPPIRLKTIIEIAKPRQDCKTGFGFCGFWENLTIARQANAGFGILDGQVSIFFRIEDLNNELRGELENTSTFEVGRDAELNEKICNALQVPAGTQLRPGTYTIFYREPYHVIQCPMQ